MHFIEIIIPDMEPPRGNWIPPVISDTLLASGITHSFDGWRDEAERRVCSFGVDDFLKCGLDVIIQTLRDGKVSGETTIYVASPEVGQGVAGVTLRLGDLTRGT